jgi:ribosomal protein L40E
MQVVVCRKCNAKNRVDETRLASSEAKCGSNRRAGFEAVGNYGSNF